MKLLNWIKKKKNNKVKEKFITKEQLLNSNCFVIPSSAISNGVIYVAKNE